MTLNIRFWCALIALAFVTACSKVPEDVASEDTNLTQEQQIDKSAETLEEAADAAMQIEIDSLNNVEPEANSGKVEQDDKDQNSEDAE
ncbi:hypothetical protein ACR9YC_07270 [Parasphingorhabdus sp. DH2-15]|uniref:hypothetical protein n=1 Tax=Parasphingorhabdus sp. DH2-15 TaxID=3444112 RepID=UPI003F6872BB